MNSFNLCLVFFCLTNPVVVGYTLGGIFLGLFLWQADLFSPGLVPLRVILRLIFVSLLINIPAGAMVELA
jgi:hypothetical protein